MASLIGVAVDQAVDFDRQFLLGAIEVEDVGADGVLASELQPLKLAPF